MEVEDRFCKDFQCCGVTLRDLHELLNHFEECHVHIETDNVTKSDDHLFDDDYIIPFQLDQEDSSELSDDDDDELLVHLTGSMEGSNASLALCDMYLRRCSLDQPMEDAVSLSPKSAVPSACNWSPIPIDHSISAFDNAVFKTNQGKDQSKRVGFSKADSPFRNTPEIKKEQTPPAIAEALINPLHKEMKDMAPTQFRHTYRRFSSTRPFKCSFEGCLKAYKNRGGLKYHMRYGHCEETGDPHKDSILHKPYECTVDKCGKRYKNLNGLKYHIQHQHLALLMPSSELLDK